MDIIYRAFDGKEFDDEEECEAYERRAQMPKELMGFKLFDDTGAETKLFDEEYRVNEEIFFIITHSAEEAEALHEVLHDEGISSPWDKGWGTRTAREFCAGEFFYDSSEDDWFDFATYEQRFLEIRKVFRGE